MKRLMLVGVLAVVLVLAMAVPAMAKSGKPKHSKMVLNITYKVTNDPDSGQSGNTWALDNLNRHVKIWQTADGSYYVIAKDNGKWNTIAGVTSPGDQAVPEGADATGTVHGGYTATFTAPAIVGAKNGNLGTFDYQGDFLGTPPVVFDWLGTYFPGNSGLTYVDWAWTYIFQGQKWVNAMAGNSGDIVIPAP